MDPLIRGALGIGDAPWPPEYATLLGLDPAAASADEVEAAVLERMERLRQYQIRLPEPVTEAMNLLARALDDLTSGGGPAPLPATEEAVLAIEEPLLPVAANKPQQSQPPIPAVSNDPGVGVFAPPPTPKVFATSVRRFRRPRRAVAAPPLKPAAEPPPWPAPTDPRRKAVYDRVRMRRALAAWEEVGALWTPGARPQTRGEWVGVVVALRGIARLGDAIPPEGGPILIWARSRPGTQALLELPPTRRQTLQIDWHNGLVQLRDRYQRARDRSRWMRRLRRHGAYWLAFGLLAITLLIVTWRAVSAAE